MVVDKMFVLATLAFAWGLSLVTYKWFATRNQWTIGEVQAKSRGLAVLLGAVAMILALAFAYFRLLYGGWGIPAFGIVLGLFWTVVAHRYAQVALFLAPVSAAALAYNWMFHVVE